MQSQHGVATLTFEMTIAWGDCDSLGIVFYPNYFRWFDTSFQHLLAVCGFDQRSLSERFGIVGTPIADVGARFSNPATYGDDIIIDSEIAEWRDKLFLVNHTAHRGDTLLATGHELRVWGIIEPETGKLRAAPIAPEFRQAMGG